MRNVALAFALAIGSVGCGGVTTAPQDSGAVTITEVVPAQGPLAGNIPVQIKGTGFVADNLLVTFGGSSVDDAQVIDATTIRGTLPPRSTAGAVDVVVACRAGQKTLANGFTYSAAAGLTITGINPPNGPVTGGTTVTITGTGFQGAGTTVKFGQNNGTGVTVASDTQLTVLTPAAAGPGAVAVAVQNANGTAALPNAFVYGNGGPPTGGTVSENLGGWTEFNLTRVGNGAPFAEGYSEYFNQTGMLFPAPGTCILDLNQLPGATRLDAGANVTINQGTESLTLPKNTSNGYPTYRQQNAPASKFLTGQMAGIAGVGGGGVGAFNDPDVASAPVADYSAWMDPFGVWSFEGGGTWFGSSDLYVMWGEGSMGNVPNPVDHIQVGVVGQDGSGNTHVLYCDARAGADTGAFCIKGGGGSDLCQTGGATMTDFYTALGSPGFGAANVVLYRGNRSLYDLPNGAKASMDVSVVKVGSLILGN